MLLNNAQDIISNSYFKLGDLTLLRMRNYGNGYGKSQKQKQLYLQSRLIRLNLGSVLDHVSYDDNGNLQYALRSTDEQINRFLKTLESIAEIDLYAVAPTLFHKIKPKVINQGTNGINASPLILQYSVDGSTSWHTTWVPGDLYERTSVDGGVSWSPAIYFIDTTTFVKKAGDTMGGNLDFGGTKKVTGITNGSSANDAVNKSQLDSSLTTAESYTDASLVTAKSYADGLVVGLWDDRGSFSAVGGAYPSSGGSGISGAILKGDIWTISVAGTLPSGQSVQIGDTVRALIDTPGNTQSNWSILQTNTGYVPVNKAGDTMSGVLTMGGNKITGLATATNPSDAARFDQIPTVLSGYYDSGTTPISTNTGGGQVTLLTISTTSNKNFIIESDLASTWQAASGTPGDGGFCKKIASFSNVSGTLTQKGSEAIIYDVRSSGSTSPTIGFSISGSNLLVQASFGPGSIYGCRCKARVVDI